jgi:hypothetical protein
MRSARFLATAGPSLVSFRISGTPKDGAFRRSKVGYRRHACRGFSRQPPDFRIFAPRDQKTGNGRVGCIQCCLPTTPIARVCPGRSLRFPDLKTAAIGGELSLASINYQLVRHTFARSG